LKRWKKTLQRFGPEPGGRDYRVGLMSPVADSASTCGFDDAGLRAEDVSIESASVRQQSAARVAGDSGVARGH